MSDKDDLIYDEDDSSTSKPHENNFSSNSFGVTSIST